MRRIFKPLVLAGITTLLIACDKQQDKDLMPISEKARQAAQLVGVGEAHEDVARKLAKTLGNAKMRGFLKAEALKQFDGDYDVLFSNLITYATNNKEVAELRELGAIAEKFPLLNVAIPVNINEWDAQSYEPLVAYLPENYDEKNATQITAFDAAGNIHLLDAKQAPTVPVIVISQNERTELEQGKVVVKKGLIGAINTSGKVATQNTNGNLKAKSTSDLHGPEFCSTMPFDQVLYLRGMNTGNMSAIEDWSLGAPEIRMNIHYLDQNTAVQKIIYGNGTQTGNLWEPGRRSYMDNNWWNFTDRLMRWSTSYGEIINLTFWEEDSGSIIKFNIKVEGEIDGVKVTADGVVNIKNDDDFIGTYPVDRTFCANSAIQPHGNQTLKFQLDYDMY